MNDLVVVGDMFAKSSMFGIGNPAAGMVVAMTCYQQKITPLEFIRTYHIIDGKPSMKADAMAAEFRKRGGKYKVLSHTDAEAKAEFEFESNKTKFSYTMDEAKKQGICFKSDGKTLKDNWRKFPANMLWARMMSNACRVLCPEINSGIYTPEEVMDMTTDNAVSEAPISKETMKNITNEIKEEKPKPQPKKKTVPKSEPKKDSPFNAEPESPAEDFSICPIGQLKGKAWEEMPSEHLKMALQVKEIDQGYKDYINTVLETRGDNE